MTAILRKMLRDEKASVAAEFILVLPLLILMIFGTIDVGGYAWRVNMAQKATQFGTRVAVVTDPVAPALATENYVGPTYGLSQGQIIPKSALGMIRCVSTGCTCITAPCPANLGFSSDAFNRIITRMRGAEPQIADGNVTIEYRGSGLGYAGDPYGMDINPLVTVRISGDDAPWEYRPWMGLIFAGGIDLPQASYTLTMEDGSGSRSN